MHRSSTVLALAIGVLTAPLAAQPKAPASAAQTRYVLVPAGTEARYVVRELLAANTIENDVVGKTTAVTGTVTLDAASRVISDGSRIVIDLTTLKTDKDRRDGYVQRRTLKTAEHPNAVLVVREMKGLPSTLPTTGSLSVTLVGDLTLVGVTRPTTWTVKATASAQGLTGTAKTSFLFSEFGIDVPKVPVVARVDDPITLELDFAFERQTVANP
jgi:polyisoprenoid-binding protein YceI